MKPIFHLSANSLLQMILQRWASQKHATKNALCSEMNSVRFMCYETLFPIILEIELLSFHYSHAVKY